MSGGIEIGGQIHKANQYQVPYDMLYKFIDNLNLKKMSDLDVLKKAFEFGYMLVALNEEDYKARIANLNAQNLKWFTKAEALEAEVVKLRQILEQQKTSGPEAGMLKSPPSNEDSSNVLELPFPELDGSLKKQDQSGESQMSSDASTESTSSLS